MNADSGVPVTRLKVDGGMTANHLLMQFVADVLDVPVERPLGSEAVSLGAAYAAGLAVGYWSDLEVLRANWHRAAGLGAGAWTRPAAAREHANWGRAVDRSYGWVQARPTDRRLETPCGSGARPQGGRPDRVAGAARPPARRASRRPPAGRRPARRARRSPRPPRSSACRARRRRRRRGAGRRPSPPASRRRVERQPLAAPSRPRPPCRPGRSTWSAPPTSAKCSAMPTPATICRASVLGLGGGDGQPQPGRRAAASSSAGTPGRAGCGWPPPGRRMRGRRRWWPPSARRSGRARAAPPRTAGRPAGAAGGGRSRDRRRRPAPRPGAR